MIRDEYLRRLVDDAYVDVYLSANDGHRIYWPWRMHPPHESSPAYRNACEQYIIDSAPQRPATGNKDVLDEAVRVGADAVLLADYFPFEMYEPGGPYELTPDDDPIQYEAYRGAKREYGDAYTATVARVTAGMELAETHPFDGDVIVPLQAPYADAIDDLPDADRYAIGGLNKSDDAARVAAAEEVRLKRPNAWIHGLGWGAREGLVAAVHDNPNLIDAVDYSSPVQTVQDGTIDAGDERMSVAAARAGAMLVEDLRRFSPHLSDPPTRPDHNQTGVGEWS